MAIILGSGIKGKNVKQISEHIKKIKEAKKRIDDTRLLSDTELRELQKWYRITYTYNSNAIEGNTLSLAETK